MRFMLHLCNSIVMLFSIFNDIFNLLSKYIVNVSTYLCQMYLIVAFMYMEFQSYV